MDILDRHEAADWFARLQAPDCDEVVRERFARWLDEPDHQAAYAEMKQVHELALQLRFDPEIRAATREARDLPGSRRRSARTLAGLLATAAVLVLAVTVLVWQAGPASRTYYETHVGEQRQEILADGSVLVLDTASAVTVRLGRNERRVTLERGRVQFKVASDPARPFIVRAGKGIIRDIGTKFQVRRDGTGDDVTVVLLEGLVSVSVPSGQNREIRTATLVPGQQARFGSSGRLRLTTGIDLSAARAWTRGDLVFQNRPLRELLGEMNRYTRTSIMLEDPGLGSIPISGVFHQADQESLLLALQAGWSLESRRDANGDVTLFRADDP